MSEFFLLDIKYNIQTRDKVKIIFLHALSHTSASAPDT